jgi:hypothetical protein
MCENICNIQINTLATYVWKTDKTLERDSCNIRIQSLQHMQQPNLLLQHPYENACNVPLKHLKHLKCELAICITSRCRLLRRLHRGATAIAASEAGGLPCQGLTLLLVLAVPVGVVRPDGGAVTGARRRPCGTEATSKSSGAGARSSGRSSGAGGGATEGDTGGGGEVGATQGEQQKGPNMRFIGLAGPQIQARGVRTGRTPTSYDRYKFEAICNRGKQSFNKQMRNKSTRCKKLGVCGIIPRIYHWMWNMKGLYKHHIR